MELERVEEMQNTRDFEKVKYTRNENKVARETPDPGDRAPSHTRPHFPASPDLKLTMCKQGKQSLDPWVGSLISIALGA